MRLDYYHTFVVCVIFM